MSIACREKTIGIFVFQCENVPVNGWRGEWMRKFGYVGMREAIYLLTSRYDAELVRVNFTLLSISTSIVQWYFREL